MWKLKMMLFVSMQLSLNPSVRFPRPLPLTSPHTFRNQLLPAEKYIFKDFKTNITGEIRIYLPYYTSLLIIIYSFLINKIQREIYSLSLHYETCTRSQNLIWPKLYGMINDSLCARKKYLCKTLIQFLIHSSIFILARQRRLKRSTFH